MRVNIQIQFRMISTIFCGQSTSKSSVDIAAKQSATRARVNSHVLRSSRLKPHSHTYVYSIPQKSPQHKLTSRTAHTSLTRRHRNHIYAGRELFTFVGHNQSQQPRFGRDWRARVNRIGLHWRGNDADVCVCVWKRDV